MSVFITHMLGALTKSLSRRAQQRANQLPCSHLHLISKRAVLKKKVAWRKAALRNFIDGRMRQ
jgi:hypothetical protein